MSPRIPIIRFSDLDLSHPQVKTAADVLQRTVAANLAGHATGCVISGAHGAGKTTLAYAAMWRAGAYVPWKLSEEDGEFDWDRAAPIAQFMTAQDLIVRQLDTTRADNLVALNWKERGIPFTIVDDVGREGIIPYISTNDRTQLEELRHRYWLLLDYCAERARHGLILTTNLTLTPTNQLAALLGDANWSRLLKLCPIGNMVSLHTVPDRRIVIGGRQPDGAITAKPAAAARFPAQAPRNRSNP